MAVWRIVDTASSSSDDYLLVFVASGLYPSGQLFRNVGMIGTPTFLGRGTLDEPPMFFIILDLNDNIFVASR